MNPAGAPGKLRRRTRLAWWLVAFSVALVLFPRWWCGRDASRWFAGDVALQSSLAEGVAAWVERPLARDDFSTGSKLFNGEWLFGTYMMAGMGFGQVALEHPSLRASCLRRMDACIAQMIERPVRAFDAERWKNDALDSLEAADDHAAYLGYLNLVLSFRRRLESNSPFAALNDQVTEALARHLTNTPLRLLQSYPGEVYPVDNAAVVASIALHDRALGQPARTLVGEWMARCRQQWLHPPTGLLYQAIVAGSGRPGDAPRGSGTCLAAYFLSFADAELSADLYRAAQQHLQRSVLGFGIVREYPLCVPAGWGDIDSGPVLFGYGISPTGFSLGAARLHHDRDAYQSIYRTVHLFGAPIEPAGRRQFVSGGPIGNAIMFAMLTATPKAAPPTGGGR